MSTGNGRINGVTTLGGRDQAHLRRARGYLELGMCKDALAELRQIEESRSGLTEVVSIGLAAAEGAGKWKLMESLARHLVEYEPGNPEWVIVLARVLRRRKSVRAAINVLNSYSFHRLPDAGVHYHLARYHCEVGLLLAAREHLKIAFRYKPEMRLAALDDADLRPVWDSL